MQEVGDEGPKPPRKNLAPDEVSAPSRIDFGPPVDLSLFANNFAPGHGCREENNGGYPKFEKFDAYKEKLV